MITFINYYDSISSYNHFCHDRLLQGSRGWTGYDSIIFKANQIAPKSKPSQAKPKWRDFKIFKQ